MENAGLIGAAEDAPVMFCGGSRTATCPSSAMLKPFMIFLRVDQNFESRKRFKGTRIVPLKSWDLAARAAGQCDERRHGGAAVLRSERFVPCRLGIDPGREPKRLFTLNETNIHAVCDLHAAYVC